MSYPFNQLANYTPKAPQSSYRGFGDGLLVHGFPTNYYGHRAVYRRENPYGHSPDGLTDEFLLRCGYVPVTPAKLVELAEWWWKGGQFTVTGNITFSQRLTTPNNQYAPVLNYTSVSPTLDPFTVHQWNGLDYFPDLPYKFPNERVGGRGFRCKQYADLFPNAVWDENGYDIIDTGPPDPNARNCSWGNGFSVLWNRDDDQPWGDVPLYVATDFSFGWYRIRNPNGWDATSVGCATNHSYSMQYPVSFDLGSATSKIFSAWLDIRGVLFPLGTSLEYPDGNYIRTQGTLVMTKTADIEFFAP